MESWTDNKMGDEKVSIAPAAKKQGLNLATLETSWPHLATGKHVREAGWVVRNELAYLPEQTRLDWSNVAVLGIAVQVEHHESSRVGCQEKTGNVALAKCATKFSGNWSHNDFSVTQRLATHCIKCLYVRIIRVKIPRQPNQLLKRTGTTKSFHGKNMQSASSGNVFKS